MVDIETKNIQQIGNGEGVILPTRFLRKFSLKKGTPVNMIVMDKAVMIVTPNTDFNSDEIKVELAEAQKQWEVKEKEDQFMWITKLPQKDQNELEEAFEFTEKAIETFESKTGLKWSLNNQHWDEQPQGANLSKKELLLHHLSSQRIALAVELMKVSNIYKEAKAEVDAAKGNTVNEKIHNLLEERRTNSEKFDIDRFAEHFSPEEAKKMKQEYNKYIGAEKEIQEALADLEKNKGKAGDKK
jgi:antitoxin component of MazEF toxin-antitoxin module